MVKHRVAGILVKYSFYFVFAAIFLFSCFIFSSVFAQDTQCPSVASIVELSHSNEIHGSSVSSILAGKIGNQNYLVGSCSFSIKSYIGTLLIFFFVVILLSMIVAIKQLMAEFDKLKKVVKGISLQNDDLKIENSRLKSELEVRFKEIKECEQSLKDLTERNNELSNIIVAKDKEITEWIKVRDDLEWRKGELITELENKNKEVQWLYTVKTEFEQRANQLETKTAELASQNEHKDREIIELSKTRNGLECRKGELESQNRELSSALITCDKEIQDFVKAANDRESEFAETKKDKACLEARMREVFSELDKTISDNRKLVIDIENQKKSAVELSLLKNLLEEKEKSIVQAKIALQEKTKQIEYLKKIEEKLVPAISESTKHSSSPTPAPPPMPPIQAALPPPAQRVARKPYKKKKKVSHEESPRLNVLDIVKAFFSF